MDSYLVATVTGTVPTADHIVNSFDGLTAVDEVSFIIHPSETHGLLGPHGAGKTAIISMVAGLIPAEAGSVTMAGTTMTEPTKKFQGRMQRRLNIGMGITAPSAIAVPGP